MLMKRYKNLPPFADAAPSLASLKSGGHFLAPFSNGETEAIRGLLEKCAIVITA